MLDRWHKKEKPHFSGYWFGLGGGGAGAPQSVQATGGNSVTTSGIYTIHTFTSPGNFVVTNGGEVEYLIVGGGGGGGCGDAPPDSEAEGGGGGAGAVYSTDPAIPAPQRKSPITVTAQTYPIVIGSGGAGAPGEVNGAALGGNGGVSSALGVTVGGGGGGGSRNAGYPHPNPIPSHNNAGVPGPVASGPAPTDNAGSGGGGGQADDTYGPPGESTGGPLGKAGGHGHFNSTPSATGGGGGGGFTDAGDPSTGDPAYGGAGGDGITLTIPGSPLAVGGGGGGAGVRSLTFPQTYGSAGGLGGGGKGGRQDINGEDGTANTGGGGGGSGRDGGDGGSGIVVIRYVT